MEELGAKLAQLRKEKGLSQEELAKILHLNQSTIAYYETGKKRPSYEVLQELASFFNVSVDYLLGRTDDPRPVEEIAEEKRYIPGTSVKGVLGGRSSSSDIPSESSQSDHSAPAWWYRDTPPTDVELEEFLKTANVYFDGAPLDEEDKEDIITYLKVKWEREKRKREREGK